MSGIDIDQDTPMVIEVRQVERTYPGPPEVPALRSTDLVMRRGDYLAVVGPSGSGKSTLLNILGLLDRPTAGQYLLDGLDTAGLSERDRCALRGRRIGFVFQSFHLLPYRTTTENVMLAQIYTGPGPARRRDAARDALIQVGLGHRLDALPNTLSGGERQRVAIARALVNNPALLLCDEPTGNLDSHTATAIMDLLDELHHAGATIVLITHDSSTSARARQVAQMRDGRLTMDAGTELAHA